MYFNKKKILLFDIVQTSLKIQSILAVRAITDQKLF